MCHRAQQRASSAPSAAAAVSACDLLRGDSVNRQKLLEWDGSVFFLLLFLGSRDVVSSIPHRAGEEWLFHGKLVFSGAAEMRKNTLQMPGFGAILAHLPARGAGRSLRTDGERNRVFSPLGIWESWCSTAVETAVEKRGSAAPALEAPQWLLGQRGR